MNLASTVQRVSLTMDGGLNWKTILGFQSEGVVFPLGWGISASFKKSQFSTSHLLRLETL